MKTNTTPQNTVNQPLSRPEKLAREILAAKRRVKYRLATGVYFEDTDAEYNWYIALTDAEAQRVTELLIQTYNNGMPQDQQVTSLHEIKDFELGELRGENAELDQLLFDKTPDNIIFQNVDMDTIHHLYKMTCAQYDMDQEQMMDPVTFRVCLTDDEYLYLLSHEIAHRGVFHFNSLVTSNPDLALKIHQAADGCENEYYWPSIYPFLILLDEVKSDVEDYLGPRHDSFVLYESIEDGYFHVVMADYDSRQVTLDHTLINGVDPNVSEALSDIPLDRLLALFHATDADEMLHAMQSKFPFEDCFVQIRTLLDAEQIPYEYQREEYSND